MEIIVNSIAILTALFIGIFLGAKSDAKNAIIESVKNTAKLLKSNKAVIISPLNIFRRNQMKKELSSNELWEKK